MRILVRLLGYLRGHLVAVTLAYLSLAGAVVFTSLTPWMIKHAIDAGIQQHSERALVISALAIVGFSAGKGLCAYLQSYLGEYLSQTVAYDLRRDFYQKVQTLSFAFHDEVDTGQMMSRATVDVEVSRQFLSMGLLRSVYTFGLAIVVAVIMWTMNWQLALLVFLTIPIVAVLSTNFSKRTRPIWTQVQQQLGVETSVLQESITGIRAVKAYGQEESQYQRFRAANWAVRELSLRANQIAAFTQPFLLYILNAISLAILWYGGHLVLGGSLTIGTLVAFTEYRAQLAAPVRMLGFMLNLATRAISAGERIFEIIDRPSEVQDAPHAQPLGRVRGHVRYEHVTFGYAQLDRPVVEDICIDARPGETIALLGPTGSGKTTVLHLLPRFYDATGGQITIDGFDIRDVTLESLRQTVGVVLQDVFLFNATVRENIAYGKPSATQAEIERAARIAQIHDFIVSLPDGYDTWVSERGVTLSGGQKQRIAIARTLLMNPAVLVLDDSTSAVDMETEYLIQQALAELIKGRTSFVIAHRLRTVKQADQILVLEGGRIVQRGRHEELLAQPGLYQEIYHLQLRDQEEALAGAGELTTEAPA
ncbi:MAG TPA: ABC transporter ATP-binding protein [Thermomicrobiales bacterium]|jgi:ATP-binding cassette subfamily B protein|nr:ABC transporter ATP-binding protein [Thermomicrobiales bacterium]